MQCKTCRYYDEADANEGWCKRHAPRTFLVGADRSELDIEQNAWWPGVYAHDWCGEYVWDQASKSLNEKINEFYD